MNPYGMSKLMIENISDTFLIAQAGLSILRYFNPIGAHASGIIGEDLGNTKNLMPITQTAIILIIMLILVAVALNEYIGIPALWSFNLGTGRNLCFRVN